MASSMAEARRRCDRGAGGMGHGAQPCLTASAHCCHCDTDHSFQPVVRSATGCDRSWRCARPMALPRRSAIDPESVSLPVSRTIGVVSLAAFLLLLAGLPILNGFLQYQVVKLFDAWHSPSKATMKPEIPLSQLALFGLIGADGGHVCNGIYYRPARLNDSPGVRRAAPGGPAP